MIALPPTPDARSQPGKTAGIGGVALGALVALAVAARFLVLPGADRSSCPGGRERAQTRADPIARHAPADSHASRRVASHAVPIGATHAPQGHRTTTKRNLA
jgi:hypothetical protein